MNRNALVRMAAWAPMALLATAVLPAPPAGAGTPPTGSAAPQVLRVGTWNGIPGNVATLDRAVAKLRPGGWLLVGPGDWHPQMDHGAAQRGSRYPSAMLVTTPDVHVRGMDRNRVVIDGTKPTAATSCSASPADQDLGQVVNGTPQGRNGPEALYANGVWFENFTTCNFLTGSADSGNQVWWNGGDDSGRIGMGAWWGGYLSATSTFFDPAKPGDAAQYGLFVSNARGPGQMDQTYASNMNDSSYYIGACPDCNGVIDHGHAENSALGLSSTNAGGNLLVENTEWDNNKTGMVSNSQNSADPPTPQDGACPGGTPGPLGTGSCTIWKDNYVHDNNNPDVPYQGTAALGPVGTGMVFAGSRHSTMIGNRVVHNGSWGVLVTFFPDTSPENPHNVSNCHGGAPAQPVPGLGGQAVPCLFDAFGNQVRSNRFSGNGFFANPTNGDIADLTYGPPPENPTASGNCYPGNTDPAGLTTTPSEPLFSVMQGSCQRPAAFPNQYAPAQFALLGGEVACASAAFGPCPPGLPAASYPQTTAVRMMPLPPQPTMPNPCAGVPANPWCPAAAAAPAAVPAAAPAPGPPGRHQNGPLSSPNVSVSRRFSA